MKWQVLRSYILLLRIGALMHWRGMQSVHKKVLNARIRDRSGRGNVELEELCHAVELACIFYPRRVLCLQRSAATVLLLRARGFKAEMVIGVQTLAETLIRSMTERPVSPRFEVLIDELRKTRDPLLSVARIFSSNGFNNIHAFLDEVLQRSASVITTNFDNCIENVANRSKAGYSRIVFTGRDPAPFHPEGGVLAKIHGSNPLTIGEVPHLLITVHTLAQATGGFRRFPVWRDFIHSRLRDRLLIVFGYSGSDDFDLTPLLLEAQPSAMVWFDYAAKAEARFVPSNSLPTRIRRFAALPGATFAQGDLAMFVQELQELYGLPIGRTKDQSDMYTVANYVRELYPNAEAREELLNILLGHFGQFDVITSRDASIRSPLLDAQRVQALYARSEYGKACDLFESFAEPIPSGYARARAHFAYSASLYYRGKSEEALSIARASLGELVASGDTENQVQLLNHIGGMHFTRLEDEDAAACYERVRELHEKSPISIEAEGAALWGMGSIALRRGDTVEAAPRYSAALEIYESLGYGVRVAWIRHNLGELALLEKRYRDALEVLEPAERVFRELQGHSGLLYVVNAQAKAQYALRDWLAAETSIRECLEIISQFPDEPTAPEVLLLIVLASHHKRISVEIEFLSRSVIPRVIDEREESPAVSLLRTAIAEQFSPSAVAAIQVHLFGE